MPRELDESESTRSQVSFCFHCKHYRTPDFCELLPWNDTRFKSPIAKYIMWQGHPCPNYPKPPPVQLPLSSILPGQAPTLETGTLAEPS